MGTWSTSIMGNDTSAEVGEYFKRMYSYQEGGGYKWSVEQIGDSLYTYYYETIRDLPSEKCAFFFTIAQALWKRGKLTTGLRKIVHHLIFNKTDLDAWKELNADEKTLKKRWQETTRFYESLLRKSDPVTARVLKPSKISVFTSGTCLAFPFQGHYYGVVVADDGRNRDDGTNDLLIVDIKSKTIPSLADFKGSFVLLNDEVANHFSGNDNVRDAVPGVAHSFCFSRAAMNKFRQSSVWVGQLDLTRTFFVSSTIRFNSLTAKHKTVEAMLEQALSYWSKHPWRKSGYKAAYEIKLRFSPGMLAKDHLVFGKKKFPLRDIDVKVRNGLWHVDVTIRIKGVSRPVIEEYWNYFVAVFEKLTGREVNNFSIAEPDEKDLQAFQKFDFKKFNLKHVTDQGIIQG